MIGRARAARTRGAGPSPAEPARPAELYDAWLFAAADATLALADWRMATGDEKPGAYAAYVAALDREGHAAVVLERRVIAAGL